jgi:inhibitor of cysteine peptidase
MKRLSFFILTILSLNVFAAGNNVPIFTEENPQIHLNSNQQRFMIRLKSNPTTGYSWDFNSNDKKHIALIQHDFEKPNTGLVGAPGYETWLFEIKDSQFNLIKLDFVYRRAWEQGAIGKQVIFELIR